MQRVQFDGISNLGFRWREPITWSTVWFWARTHLTSRTTCSSQNSFCPLTMRNSTRPNTTLREEVSRFLEINAFWAIIGKMLPLKIHEWAHSLLLIILQNCLWFKKQIYSLISLGHFYFYRIRRFRSDHRENRLRDQDQPRRRGEQGALHAAEPRHHRHQVAQLRCKSRMLILSIIWLLICRCSCSTTRSIPLCRKTVFASRSSDSRATPKRAMDSPGTTIRRDTFCRLPTIKL